MTPKTNEPLRRKGNGRGKTSLGFFPRHGSSTRTFRGGANISLSECAVLLPLGGGGLTPAGIGTADLAGLSDSRMTRLVENLAKTASW
jgi:hypothetical protein